VLYFQYEIARLHVSGTGGRSCELRVVFVALLVLFGLAGWLAWWHRWLAGWLAGCWLLVAGGERTLDTFDVRKIFFFFSDSRQNAGCSAHQMYK
jgi:hypothetical protein